MFSDRRGFQNCEIKKNSLYAYLSNRLRDVVLGSSSQRLFWIRNLIFLENSVTWLDKKLELGILTWYFLREKNLLPHFQKWLFSSPEGYFIWAAITQHRPSVSVGRLLLLWEPLLQQKSWKDTHVIMLPRWVISFNFMTLKCRQWDDGFKLTTVSDRKVWTHLTDCHLDA